MEKYLYDIEDTPKEYRGFFENLNKTIKAAFAKPGQLKRNAPGIYYIVLDDELIQIDNQADEGGEWIAKECSNRARWYTDGHKTLKELKKELGI